MGHIAIVDDSHISRSFLEVILHRQGYETVGLEPTSVPLVLDNLRSNPPELLLLDLMMSDCPGHDLLVAMRGDKTLKDVPVVVVTALRDPEAMAVMQHLGISGCLFKPVQSEELITCLRQAMG